MSAHGISDVKCRRTEFLPGWTELCCAKRDRLRVQGVGTPLPDDTECTWLSGSTPSGFLKRTCGALPYPGSLREKHTTLMNITPGRQHILSGYVVRIMTKVSKPSHNPRSAAILSGHLLLLVFQICLWQRTLKFRFFTFLSFPLLCHGFQRTLLNLKLLW